VLGGKKFHGRMILHLWWRGTLQSTSTGIIKAQTPERAVTQLRIPGDWKAGDCVAFLDTVVTRVDFKVSGAPAGKAAGRGTGQAAASAATLVGEGDMQLMEIVTTMRRSLAGGAKIQGVVRKGRLVMTPESVTFVQEGTTLFEEPTSSVREVSPIGRAGRPTGFFRIAFSNGKIYNFQDPKANSPDRSSYLMVKKALGK
jgi:hypothetical protein